MQDIAIYGAGGFGRELVYLIDKINKANPTWNFIGFFDDGLEKGTPVMHFGPVLGGFDDLNNWDRPIAVAVAIASSHIRKKIASGITNPNVEFPNVITPNAVITDPESFKIGRGNVMQAPASFTVNVQIGDFNVFNGGTVVGHDVRMGDYNIVMPGVRISGETKIGDENFFGVGSIVLQGMKVGHGVKLGAGSVLMTKPKDDNLYIGVPAKLQRLT